MKRPWTLRNKITFYSCTFSIRSERERGARSNKLALAATTVMKMTNTYNSYAYELKIVQNDVKTSFIAETATKKICTKFNFGCSCLIIVSNSFLSTFILSFSFKPTWRRRSNGWVFGYYYILCRRKLSFCKHMNACTVTFIVSLFVHIGLQDALQCFHFWSTNGPARPDWDPTADLLSIRTSASLPYRFVRTSSWSRRADRLASRPDDGPSAAAASSARIFTGFVCLVGR